MINASKRTSQTEISGPSAVLPPAPNRLGIERIEDLLTPTEQDSLHEDLAEIAQTRSRAMGSLATHLFGADSAEPIQKTPEDEPEATGWSRLPEISFECSVARAKQQPNFVDVERSNPDTIILSYDTGSGSFTLEA